MSYIGNQPTSVAFLTDTFSGNASATTFTLSAAPATTSSIIVAVSGVLQDPSTYAVAGTTLTFSAAPPTGTDNISVRFLGIPASGVTTTAYRTVTEFTATAGQTTFSVPSYTVGYIDVYQNGVLLGSDDYTATNGTTVVLAAGATAGDLVETISFQVSSVLNAVQPTGATFSGNVLFASGNGIWNTSGNVGIGTSSPNQNGTGVTCHINSSTAGTWATTHYTNGSTGSAAADGLLVGTLGADGAYVFNYENTPMIFATNSVERMRLAASGELSINTTSVYVSSKINILGAGSGAWGITIVNPSSATTAMPVFVSLNAAGVVVGYINSDNTSTAYITSSDYRLKENIAPMTGALEKVALLKPCTYTWKSDGSSGEGFIAHELAEVCPSAVSGEKDAVFEDGSIKPQGIDTSFLVATLTAAIQELKAEVDSLKAEVKELKGAA